MDNISGSRKTKLINWIKLVSQNFPWISLLLIIIAGGLIGYLSGFFMPHIYEAKAVLTVNIDLKVNTPIVTEIMVDSQLNYIGELMYNPKIVEPLLAEETKSGNPLTIKDLKSMASVERQLMSTIIKVRGKDPVIVARIASNWSKIGYETLVEAKDHALLASEARQQIALLDTCYPTATDSTTNKPADVTNQAFCEGLTIQSAEVKLAEATKMLTDEETKTLGLMPYMNVSQYIPASIPTVPTSTNQGILTLSGMVIGIVIGIVFVDLRRLKNIDEN